MRLKPLRWALGLLTLTTLTVSGLENQKAPALNRQGLNLPALVPAAQALPDLALPALEIGAVGPAAPPIAVQQTPGGEGLAISALWHDLARELSAIGNRAAAPDSDQQSGRAIINRIASVTEASSFESSSPKAAPAPSYEILKKLGIREKILRGGGIEIGPDGRIKPVKKGLKVSIHDNDDNIAYYRTKIYLRPKDPTKPEIAIPTFKFAEVRPFIGKSGEYKDYDFFDLDKEYGGSFRDLSDVLDPDIFPKDVIDAITSVPAAMFRGPSWFKWASALKHPETAAWVGVLTSRGHKPENMARGYQEFQKRGFIKNVPRTELLFGAGVASEIDKFLPKEMPIPERKLVILIELLDLIESIPLENPADRHTFGFSDDDADMIARVRDHLYEEQVRGHRWPHIDISLFSTGPGKERTDVLAIEGAHSN